MNYEHSPYHNRAVFNYPSYFLNHPSAPLAMPHMERQDPRAYPISGPGTRPRAGIGRDEDIAQSTGIPRKRIGVACARCRKRKIRCSGDTGNGTGCTNCRQAGVCQGWCQFHRVGSSDAVEVCSALGLCSNVNISFTNMGNPNTTTPTYHAGGNDFYNRGMPYLPNIDTKSTVYPENWIIPNSEETSPVETYGLDQSTPYVSTQSTLSNVYGPSHQWNGSSLRNSPTGVHTYLGQEAASSYTTSNVPNIQPGINRTSTEALSPLNMTSISSALPSSLPERPHPRQSRVMDSNVPQRQLPVPQPSPAQSTRNTVDMLQDQRLRSAQITNGNSMSLNSSSAKPPITWPTDTSMPGSDSQSIASSEASSTGHLPQASTATPVTDLTGLSVLASATTMGTKNSTTLSTQPALNFSTSTLLDTISVPSSTYSNFRNYALPTSSSTDPIHVLTQKSSESNLYRFSGDSMMKRRSLGDNSDGPSLISGHRYTPLGAPPPPSSSMGRDSVENRQQEPLHRASMSNQKRTH